MKIYNFTVIITQGDDGIYIGKVPTLSGCHTQAKSLSVLYKRIEEAIELCLEVEKEKKHTLPDEKFIGLQQIAMRV